MSMSAKEIREIVALLNRAADAYYNSEAPVMTDHAYDQLREKLEEVRPDHPFLKKVGAAAKGAVKLPYKMSSLQKIKPGTGAVESFTKRKPEDGYVVSEKLDGLSLLWCSTDNKLYLRGDGVMGVDISQFIPFIRGLKPPSLSSVKNNVVIRGELMVHPSDLPPGTLARSWTNGQVHQKTPQPEASKLRFLAYEVMEPEGIPRFQQMKWLMKLGFDTPWYIHMKEINDTILADIFEGRREKCHYDMDGIVVGEDAVPWTQSDEYKALEDAELPKDMKAFKMVLEDQCKETTVVAVHWAASYQGYLIPRIEIEPVVVGSATITFLTGHNAKNIKDKMIGPGAKIRIRRSGDVIPTLDAVLVPAASASLPPGELVWDATETHLKSVEMADLVSPRLQHFVKTLEVDGMGPGMVAKLVEKGVKGPKDLYALSVEKLSELLGPTNGQKIHRALRAPFQKGLSEMKIMISSGLMPRSVGETKLKVLFAVEPDWRLWKRYAMSCQAFESWSIGSFTEFLKVLPAYEQWRTNEFPSVNLPAATAAAVAVASAVATAATSPVEAKGVLCFTGFRNKEFEASCVQKGYTVSDTLTKKTTFLIVPDTDGYTSTKVEKAKSLGIPVVSLSKCSL